MSSPESTSPEDGAELDAPPAEVVIRLDAPVGDSTVTMTCLGDPFGPPNVGPTVKSADGQTLLIAGPTFSIPNDGVYVMPSDGSAPARRVSQPVPPGGNVMSATFAEDGQILYLLSPALFGPRELYVTSSDPITLPSNAPAREVVRSVSGR